MNVRLFLGGSALVLALSAAGLADDVEEFSKLMKEAAGANGAMQKSIETDLMAAAPPPSDEDRKRLFGLRDKDLKPAG